MSNDLRIDVAKDVETGHFVPPERADPDAKYICRDCGQEMQVIEEHSDKYGTTYRKHYRHRRDALTYVCEYRSAEDLEEIIKTAVTSYERAEAEKRLRLFLQRRVYADDYELHTQLRSLTAQEAATIRASTGKTVQAVVTLESATALAPIAPQQILPEMGAVRAVVRPEAKRHAITIRTNPNVDLSIVGEWSVDGLHTRPVFIGDEDSGESVQNPRFLAEGQTIYFFETPGRDLPTDCTRVQLGTLSLLRAVVSTANFPLLRQHIPSLKAIDTAPIRVDIVLPFIHDPRAERVIRAPEGTMCLLAVVAGKKLDPPLSVLEIGAQVSGNLPLPPAGHGKPRFLAFEMPRDRHRLLVMWPRVADREVRLDVAPALLESPTFQVPEFGVENLDTGKRALAEFDDQLPLKADIRYDPNAPIHIPRVNLLGFPRTVVRVRAEYPGPDGQPYWKDDGRVRAADFPDKVDGMIHAGARHIEVDFDTLGRVTIACDYYYEQRLRERRDEQRLRKELEKKQTRIARAEPPPPTTAPSSALEALAKRSAAEREAEAARRSVQQDTTEESRDDLYHALLKDAEMQKRIARLRTSARRVTRALAAQCLAIRNAPENKDFIDQWRGPIRRYIATLPPVKRRSRPSTPALPSKLKRVAQHAPTVRKHHDARERRERRQDPPVESTRSRRELQRRLQESARARHRATPMEDVDPPTALAESPASTPAVRSKRAHLDDIKARAKAGERVALPKSKLPKPAKRVPTLQPEIPKASPKPRSLSLADLDRRLQQHTGDLPDAIDAPFLAQLCGLRRSDAETLLDARRARIHTSLVREKRRRKTNEDSAKTLRDRR